jgi:hypothetical protein
MVVSVNHFLFNMLKCKHIEMYYINYPSLRKESNSLKTKYSNHIRSNEYTENDIRN